MQRGQFRITGVTSKLRHHCVNINTTRNLSVQIQVWNTAFRATGRGSVPEYCQQCYLRKLEIVIQHVILATRPAAHGRSFIHSSAAMRRAEGTRHA